MWSFLGKAVVAITTGGSVSKDGRALLGRGCAAHAAVHFPDLADRLGRMLQERGNHVHLLYAGLISFPVEETAWSLPDPRLIRRSALELRELADCEGWGQIVVPRPGCGYGGLVWQEVKPLLEPLLDERFIMITAA
jgi:hypothetical protein